MKRRWRIWLVVMVAVLLLGGTVAVYRLPELVRRVAVARIHAATQRPVEIERVDLRLFAGRASLHGVRLGERDGRTPFADVARLDVGVRWLPLFVGRVHLREVAVSGSTVHVVRLGDGTFNFSDLVPRGEGTPGRPLDFTVERFTLTAGKVTLEDRGLPEPRTWTSEQITIDAADLSTRGDRGRARARSITEGAPVTIELTNVRLRPVHLQASVTMEGLDVALARLYLSPEAPVVPERGRVSTSMTAVLDARDGLTADVSTRFDDVVLARPAGGEPLVLAPAITTRMSGFAFAEGALRLRELAVDGTLSVRDPLAKGAGRFRPSTVRARVSDLTWPAAGPGRLDLAASVPGGGTLAVTGTLRPPPEASDLRLRLGGVSLASWAQFVPVAARVTGVGEADLRVNEPLAAGIPARVQGTIAVNRLAVADERREVIGARRLEVSGIELIPVGGPGPRERAGGLPTKKSPEAVPGTGPARVVVKRVVVTEPRGIVERDPSGKFAVKDLLAPRTASAPAPRAALASTVPPIGVDLEEVVVNGGALSWRDQTVTPGARLDVGGIDARVTGLGWPLRGAAGVRAALRTPGSGQLRLDGRVGLEPVSADVRVTAREVALAPYRPYLPTTAQVAGAVDADVRVVVPSLTPVRATARGRLAVARVDVRDGERTVMRLERGVATSVDVDWPERVTVERVALVQPWILVERDDKGGIAVRSLLRQGPGLGPTATTEACGTVPCAEATSASEKPLAVSVAHLTVDGGGVRVVDQSVSPPFAVDLQSAAVKLDGLSTAGPRPARVELSGRLGPGSELALRGTVGPLGGPLRLDVGGELREFAVPRANPYLLRQAGWKSTEGRITSKLQCRIDGDALSARTDLRLSGLKIVRAAAGDGAQARIGLPLGMLTSLMKNRRGDIEVSLPVGGRLGDPRFDFSEAIWGAVRAVAINAVTLPVSWIGRVRFSHDSRIERIEIDPVSFEPGTPVPTVEGRTQATKLAAFLDALPEVRLSLTPVVSSRDLVALKRRPLEAAIEAIARQEGISRDAAAIQLFARRFPGQPPAESSSAVGALLEAQPVEPAEIAELAARRLESVRGTLRQAGIAGDRLSDTKLAQQDGSGRVEANLLDPETKEPSKMREALRRLGVPLKGSP